MASQETAMADQFDLYGCYQCGKCTGGCPVSLKSRLNIRRLMIEGILGRNLEHLSERLELWDCTTCKTCTLRCPRGLQPMDLVIGMRGSLVEEGHIPKTLIEAMENSFKHGNPWGKPKNKRTEWTKELPEDLKLKDFSQGDRAEYLYFVGCTAASDPRIQQIARALVLTLQHAGVDFGFLGNEEQCCGSEIRRMGESGLFEELVEKNTERFGTYQIERIVTGCPHGFNVLKNEYPQMGGEFQVFHYSEILRDLIENGKLFSKGQQNGSTIAYHDSCYLGRYNGVYKAPREILDKAGTKRVELARKGENSFCCGGGGGMMWMETNPNTRINNQRLQEVLDAQIDTVATACPYCLTMFDDAIRSKAVGEQVQVLDIVEILEEKTGDL